MTRIATAVLGPFAALYVLIAFISWSPEFNPGTWESSSRALFIFSYVYVVGMVLVLMPRKKP